jgi:transcriptional regulator with XRE-family HTH domain
VNKRLLLGDFLRRRREQLSPADLQLPVNSRRRTPGLRRDEVAGLANISTVYYERLEQGRAPQPSVKVLAAMSEALRLDDDERTHLYLLAGQAPPVRAVAAEYVDPSLVHVLRAIEDTTPGFMTDDLGNTVAQNRLNITLFGAFASLPTRSRNLIWHWFTSPQWRETLEPAEQHEATSMAYVADLRAAVAQRGHDAASTSLVDDLRSASAEFTRMWDQHVVSAPRCLPKVVHDGRVGRLDFDCLVLTSALSRQRLLLLKPAQGTPCEERLATLSTY